MIFRFPSLLLLAALTLPACTTDTPTFPGFDAAAFRADRRACAGTRQRQTATVRTLCPKLLGLRETQISALLGRPDRAELADRGRRAYSYALTPGDGCAAPNPTPLFLTLQFNAVDRVSETTVGELMNAQ